MPAPSDKKKSSAIHVKCKLSASLLNNNLSTNGQCITLVHKSEVQVMKNSDTLLTSTKSAAASQSCRTAYCEKDAVSQSRFCRLATGEHLIVATFHGQVHLLDNLGQKSVASTRLGKADDSKGVSSSETFLRGIASNGSDKLYVGSSGGSIFEIQVGDKSLLLNTKIAGHKAGVSDIAVSGGVMASGDDNGCLILRNLADNSTIAEFEGKGFPVTSVALGHGHAVVSYSTGHLRMYNVTTKSLVCEIAAHSRSITGINIHPTKPMVAACSEDTFFSVWSLPTAAAPRGVRNLLITSVNSGLLTGVTFCGKAFQLLAVSCFDSRYISVVPCPKI